MSLLKTKKQRALERLWYEKLRAEGFEDCENTELPNRPLKRWDSFYFPAKEPVRREAASRYYEAAQLLLQIHKFDNNTDRRIWELHCQGRSRDEIEAIIAKSRLKRKIAHTRIQALINRLARKLL